jgi:predicted  nucleic acid-binding Zn-ribbon protein
MGFLEKYKKNQSLIIEKQGEVLEVDKEIAQQLENIKNVKSDLSIIENRIKDDSSSKKVANELQEQLNVIKNQLSELERKVYILNVRKSNIMKDIERIEGSLR